jgi:hypothetical protein
LTIVIDAAKALDLLAGAVKARGEGHIYPDFNGACYYTASGEPDCMVGEALSQAGVSIDVLDGLNNRGAFMSDCRDYLAANGVTVTEDAGKVFRAAQERQDIGNTWGDAYKVAADLSAFFIATAKSK